MSRSIHITNKNFRDLTKKELEDQYNDPNSDLATWAKKRSIKKDVKKGRKKIKSDKQQ